MKYDTYILTALIQLIEAAASPSLGTSSLVNQSSRVLTLSNIARAKAALQPLRINNTLSMLASMKSQDIVQKNYFSHQSPTYGSPFDMIGTHGVNYICAGENLAIAKNADYAHTAWMNSKDHRNNILNPNFTEIGIGIHAKEAKDYAFTQLFIGW